MAEITMDINIDDLLLDDYDNADLNSFVLKHLKRINPNVIEALIKDGGFNTERSDEAMNKIGKALINSLNNQHTINDLLVRYFQIEKIYKEYIKDERTTV